MAWQGYVDTNLVGTGHVSKAAILGFPDGNKWAASASFAITPDEGKKLAAGFKDSASVQGAGVNVGGVKYMTIKADPRSIYGKKGATGVVAVKTGKAILVGYYDENIQPGQATNVVEKLADYLIEQGY